MRVSEVYSQCCRFKAEYDSADTVPEIRLRQDEGEAVVEKYGSIGSIRVVLW